MEDIEKEIRANYTQAAAGHEVPTALSSNHMAIIHHILGKQWKNLPAIPVAILNKFAVMINDSGIDYERHLGSVVAYDSNDDWHAWRIPMAHMVGPNNREHSEVTICGWSHGTDTGGLVGILSDLKVNKSQPESEDQKSFGFFAKAQPWFDAPTNLKTALIVAASPKNVWDSGVRPCRGHTKAHHTIQRYHAG